MDYKIGDKVVYPNHGVGTVEQISYGVLTAEPKLLHDRLFQWLGVLWSPIKPMTVWPSFRYSLRGIHQSPWLPRNGKLNSHHDWKHRFKENSSACAPGLLEVAVSSRVSFPSAAASLSPSAKRKCRTRQVPPRQRNGNVRATPPRKTPRPPS